MEEKYKRASLQIINDIFYVKGLSNRGCITLIRQYAEILCRILLNEKGHLLLGNFEKRFNKISPNSPFKEELFEHVRKLTELGNAATHLDINLPEVTKQDKESAINSLNFLISYLFINHFVKYRFGECENSMNIFSLLPPFIREIVLTRLYEIDGNNIVLMYKLPLAILKSKGFKHAIDWIEKNKSILSENNWGLSNMYQFNLNKINTLNNSQNGFKPLYSSFEEALGYYQATIEEYREFENESVANLIKLTDFIYEGRILEKYDLRKMDNYLVHTFAILSSHSPK
ncbi:DUF4145 domain-containing protein [Pasteurella canis]|uniref:DUF4145 domain-containing protein n=1 Tax=Pasteurella canis TaxID=753 RepID=UPI001D0F8DD0|nr:DUF4145 domain-containing protein [Pasteurella canis]UDW82933.1 DUF4145 domain-containing protein [Pasteurella canis]